MAGSAGHNPDNLTGYAHFYSTVVTQWQLYPSQLRPPAACKSICKLWHAARIVHCAIWEHWRHAMYFIIPGGLRFLNFQELKNMSGNGFPKHSNRMSK